MRQLTPIALASLALLTALAASGCPQPGPTVTPRPITKTTLKAVGLGGQDLDRSVNPCENFYRFACGGWIKRKQIPADQARWYRSFSEINHGNEKVLRRILRQARRTKANDPVLHKLGDFYGACLDEAAISAAGLKPLAALLAAADSVKDLASLQRALEVLHRHRVWALFDINAGQDSKRATEVIAWFDQNGMGLPSRSYYLKKGKKADALRAKYLAHIGAMLGLSGLPTTLRASAAADIMRIETALARVAKTPVQRRDPHGIYNRVDRAGLKMLTPALDWDAYFMAAGIPTVTALSVTAKGFFAGLQRLLTQEQPSAWRHYLRWHILHSFAPTLSKPFVAEDFKMTQALTGTPRLPYRWKRCIKATDSALGELLAQPYIKQRFAGSAKQGAERLVHAISAAFGELVRQLPWMDAVTKRRALDKRSKMAYLIGYPARWRPYPFAVGKVYAANVLAARVDDAARTLKRIGRPVDRQRWEMSPPTVNAYYHPNKNHMVFPAGILQPPFYSATASEVVNLGAMGMVVAHELTHGFDDQGAKFDAAGNLRNWWTAAVQKRFGAKTRCVVKQYAAWEAVPGVKLNGKLTAGENIADMGGIKLAYLAMRALRAKAPRALVADGFTEAQQFFLAYAQVWCAKLRPAWARMAARLDPHSPPQHRVNGPLKNVPPFAAAFGCQAGQTMRPQQTCTVW